MTARILVITGLALAALGGLIWLAERTGFSFGRLPGDFRIQFENFSCSFALGTSLLISILLTVGLNILVRFFNR
jgi:hypothetical protein